jgi:hypothetical protein
MTESANAERRPTASGAAEPAGDDHAPLLERAFEFRSEEGC